MDDELKQPRTANAARESLERIARALDRPVSALFHDGLATTREAETLALVRAFERISDKQARARCLAFVDPEAGNQ